MCVRVRVRGIFVPDGVDAALELALLLLVKVSRLGAPVERLLELPLEVAALGARGLLERVLLLLEAQRRDRLHLLSRSPRLHNLAVLLLQQLHAPPNLVILTDQGRRRRHA